MPDLTITASSVLKGTGARLNKSYVAGTTITAGQAVYLVSTTTGWGKAYSLGTEGEAGGNGSGGTGTFGIALHSAIANQPLAVQVSGPITIGATVVTGTPYMIGLNAGGICSFATLQSGCYVAYLGYATSTTVINLGIRKWTNVQIA